MNIKNVLNNWAIIENEYDLFFNKFAKLHRVKRAYKSDAKLIVISSINPTPSGEGKTSLLIGLTDVLNYHQYKTVGALREPSIGPVFGNKGKATGGGFSSLKDSDDINLHFTGDFYALATANNLISTIIENEIFYNSTLGIDANKIMWKRCVDLNDRGLRDIKIKIIDDVNYNTSFNITAASDLMALFCLVNNEQEFIEKLNKTIVAYSVINHPITICDLNLTDAIMSILKDAFNPNVVLTLNDNPVLMHGGPFANIAHGCNSIIATKQALTIGDYVITECGFGSDLGLEKFMNIKMQVAKLYPSLIVLCVTIKALKHHGQEYKDIEIEKGFENLLAHVQHSRFYNLEPLVILNVNTNDTQMEINLFEQLCKLHNLNYDMSYIYNNGIKNTKKLADHLIKSIQSPVHKFIYEMQDAPFEKIEKICKIAYHATKVKVAKKLLPILQRNDLKDYFVCIAKTPYSLSSDATKLGFPKDIVIEIKDLEINHAAKMIIPICDTVWRMPGLPKQPNAKNYQ